MKLHNVKIFTDENISPKVVAFLRQYGLDILDTKEQQWHGKDDEDLLNIASHKCGEAVLWDFVSEAQEPETPKCDTSMRTSLSRGCGCLSWNNSGY
jgi:hypothetical protein